MKVIDKEQKYIYKFSIPNPLTTEGQLPLVEVAKYKFRKYRPWKAKVLVDLRYLSMNLDSEKSHTLN